MSEDKRAPFAKEFNLLGAVLDLSSAAQGVVSCTTNRPGFLTCRSWSTTYAIAIALSTPAGHTFGRCTQLAIQLISRVARRGPLVLLDDQLKDVILKALLGALQATACGGLVWKGSHPLFCRWCLRERGRIGDTWCGFI